MRSNYFFCDIREEGIELFSADPRELSEPGNLTEDWLEQEVKKLIALVETACKERLTLTWRTK